MSRHTANVVWSRGDQRFTDSRYSRRHRWRFDGGIEVPGSSSPHSVRVPYSDPEAVDPEEAFVASISSCHMLWFLSIAAKRGHCVDEYAEFPMYRGSPEWLLRREEALCRGADVVFATSERLFEAKRSYNPDNTYLVHNVGDAAHFRRADDAATRVPDDLAQLPKPVVGFIGAVSPYKLNLEWIAHLASAKPSWTVALVALMWRPPAAAQAHSA